MSAAGAGAGAGAAAAPAAPADAREFRLNDAPSDGVSHLTFSPNSNLLLASSWDAVRGGWWLFLLQFARLVP